MNIRKPLALALLMTASAASAQPFATSPQPTFNFFSTNASPFSLTGSGSGDAIPDASFTCSSMENVHIPFASCTKEQLDDRKRFNGECPAKSTACKEYLQRSLSGANPAGTIAAYTPPPGQQWASPSCTHIPCLLADSPTEGDEIVVTGRRQVSEKPRDDDFVGPVLPPNENKLPPAFDAKDFQKEIADARADSQNTIVDLGDNRYGVVLEDGTVAVCGRGACNMPRPASEFPKLAEQIQMATSINSGINSLNNDNPNGFTAKSDKGKSAPGGGMPPPADDDSASSGSNGGGSLGRSFATDQANISGGGGGDASSSGSGGGASSGDGKGYIAVKPSEMEPVGRIKITHTALLKTEADINSAEKAFTSGKNGFAAPNDDTGSAAGDPPISPEHLGKIQAVENGPAQK